MREFDLKGMGDPEYHGLADCEVTASSHGADWKTTNCRSIDDRRTFYTMEWFHDRAQKTGIVTGIRLTGTIPYPLSASSKIG